MDLGLLNQRRFSAATGISTALQLIMWNESFKRRDTIPFTIMALFVYEKHIFIPQYHKIIKV